MTSKDNKFQDGPSAEMLETKNSLLQRTKKMDSIVRQANAHEAFSIEGACKAFGMVPKTPKS